MRKPVQTLAPPRRIIFSAGARDEFGVAAASNGKLYAIGGESAIRLCAVVEMIHTATLVHDDIMDEAGRHRAQPTVNARWGNSLSVLLGDCLFAHALMLSTNFENADISRATRDLDFRPATPLEEGIPSFVRWFRGNIEKS